MIPRTYRHEVCCAEEFVAARLDGRWVARIQFGQDSVVLRHEHARRDARLGQVQRSVDDHARDVVRRGAILGVHEGIDVVEDNDRFRSAVGLAVAVLSVVGAETIAGNVEKVGQSDIGHVVLSLHRRHHVHRLIEELCVRHDDTANDGRGHEELRQHTEAHYERVVQPLAVDVQSVLRVHTALVAERRQQCIRSAAAHRTCVENKTALWVLYPVSKCGAGLGVDGGVVGAASDPTAGPQIVGMAPQDAVQGHGQDKDVHHRPRQDAERAGGDGDEGRGPEERHKLRAARWSLLLRCRSPSSEKSG
eukprot:PhM_4_TR15080/c0_g1_i1/m.6598